MSYLPLLTETTYPSIYTSNKENCTIGRDGEPTAMFVLHPKGCMTRIKRYSYQLKILTYDGISPKLYEDNLENKNLGRVGLPHGTFVKHQNGNITRILEYEVRGNCSQTVFYQIYHNFPSQAKLHTYHNCKCISQGVCLNFLFFRKFPLIELTSDCHHCQCVCIPTVSVCAYQHSFFQC